MYTVLVAVDAEHATARLAAETVAAFPGLDEIEAVVLNVQQEFDTPDEGERVSSADMYDEDAFPKSIDIAEEIIKNTGVSVTRRREHGDPAGEIVDVADRVDADQIVMANRKRSPAGKALFGSVTQSVLLDTNRPVTVISED